MNSISSNHIFPNDYESIKKTLKIKQKQELIYIEGSLEAPVIVTKLVLMSRETKKRIEVDSELKTSEFSFEINITKLVESEANSDYIDLSLAVQIHQENYENIDLSTLPLEVVENVSFEEANVTEVLVRLGEFEKTSISGVETISINNKPLRLYLTKNNNLSFAFNKIYTKKPEIEVKKIELKKEQMNIEGTFFTKNSDALAAEIEMVGRDTSETVTFPLKSFQENSENDAYFGLKSYSFLVEIDLATDEYKHTYHEDIYDIYVKLTLFDESETEKVRLREPIEPTESFLEGYCIVKNKPHVYLFSPHVTQGKNNLSFVVNELESRAFFFLQLMMKTSNVLRPLLLQKKIWIVGELPYKAQDTGYHFFKYMREKHPKRNVFYVIDQKSREFNNVAQLGNILQYQSLKHMWYTLMAEKIIGSHHPEYLYPVRANAFKQLVKAKKVFLQHGIMGTRNSTHYYGAEARNFTTDLFIVSSEFEKKMIVNDFGYSASKVKVTGLSRFDSLFDRKVKVKRQLLIIPTWREWLTKEASFLKSDYFSRYQKLMNNGRLYEIAQKYNFDIILCLHPNMQKYNKHFAGKRVKIISQGEIDVQHLIKESMMMITDYSSVAFDFSFLNKPVLYYQFDREKFIGEKGSHLDLDNDLPGPIAKNETKLLKYLEEHGKNNFEMKPKYEKRAKKFLEYKDRNANKRIFKAICELE